MEREEGIAVAEAEETAEETEGAMEEATEEVVANSCTITLCLLRQKWIVLRVHIH